MVVYYWLDRHVRLVAVWDDIRLGMNWRLGNFSVVLTTLFYYVNGQEGCFYCLIVIKASLSHAVQVLGSTL